MIRTPPRGLVTSPFSCVSVCYTPPDLQDHEDLDRTYSKSTLVQVDQHCQFLPLNCMYNNHRTLDRFLPPNILQNQTYDNTFVSLSSELAISTTCKHKWTSAGWRWEKFCGVLNPESFVVYCPNGIVSWTQNRNLIKKNIQNTLNCISFTVMFRLDLWSAFACSLSSATFKQILKCTLAAPLDPKNFVPSLWSQGSKAKRPRSCECLR